jgi:hypothetical protein
LKKEIKDMEEYGYMALVTCNLYPASYKNE